MSERLRIGRANAEFQRLEALTRNRQQRRKQGRFIVEGVRAITQALEAGWPIDAIVYREPLSRWGRSLVSQTNARVSIELAPELMAQISDKEDPSELLLVAAMQQRSLGDIQHSLVVVLDRPSSPGNIGTLIRSCDALGASGLVITGHAADLYDPQTVRASMGSFFTLPSVEVPGPAELGSWINHTSVVGCSADGDTSLASYDFSSPCVVVLGNEARGISEGLRALCTSMVKIPMSGTADSLNVAVAGSIVLYEAARQRAAG